MNKDSIQKSWLVGVFLLFSFLSFPAIATEPIERVFVVPQTEKFIAKWEKSGGSELGSSQLFIDELCDLIGVPRPESPKTPFVDNPYVYEKGILFHDLFPPRKSGRIDLYKRGAFIWESKQGAEPKITNPQTEADRIRSESAQRRGTALRGTLAWDEAMVSAKAQAVEYAQAVHLEEKTYPPFILVSDIGNVIEVYADFRNTGNYTPFPSPRDHRIYLEDLRREEIKDRLRRIWLDPLSLDPARFNEKVTREVAIKLSELATSLENTGYDAETVSDFLMRCVFTMYAEDVGALPFGAFTQLLNDLEPTPEKFKPAATALWQAMKTGGYATSINHHVLKFGGYPFLETVALPLDQHQIKLLLNASLANWAHVEPAIFGSLLEKALTPTERYKLGAHYTPVSYVERLAIPTIIEPLREEWKAVQLEALEKYRQSDRRGTIQTLEAFHDRLTRLTVLDPSSGSGNFLYVSMILLKDLEGEVLSVLRDLGQTDLDFSTKRTITPAQFKGIEISPRAVAITELVLRLTYLQLHYKNHGNVHPPEPVIEATRSVELRDALIKENGSIPQRADSWPDADFIIGNPPFIGNQRIRHALGEDYTENLKKAYPEIPGSIDYVMYFWHRAAEKVRDNQTKRFGFITTNSISQPRNRQVVEHYLNGNPPLSIVMAIPDHPWIDSRDAANVRIAMTVVEKGEKSGRLSTLLLERRDTDAVKVNLDHEYGHINSNLTLGPDLTKAIPLKANQDIASAGVKVYSAGFIINQEEAKELGLGSRPDIEKVIKPYTSGRDIASYPRHAMVIDLEGLTIEEVRKGYPKIYAWILDNVKPQRDQDRDKRARENWWLFQRPRMDFRKSLEGLSRYISTVTTSKHRYFVFMDSNILPDNGLMNFAFDDAYYLGVLSSSIHLYWADATGGSLIAAGVYNKSQCFDTFPFPISSDSQKVQIRDIAEQIDTLRKAQLKAHPNLTMTEIYNLLDKVKYKVPLTEHEKHQIQRGKIRELKELHDRLDQEVIEAYGWPVDLTRTEILERLLKLNQERAKEETKGQIFGLRPGFQPQ